MTDRFGRRAAGPRNSWPALRQRPLLPEEPPVLLLNTDQYALVHRDAATAPACAESAIRARTRQEPGDVR